MPMKKIVIASVNETKVNVVKKVISSLLPKEIFYFISIDLERGGCEPVGKNACVEQIQEAIKHAKKLEPDGTYYVAMEGGIEDLGIMMDEISYVIVENAKGMQGISHAVSFPIPKQLISKIKEGQPFADAVDCLFKTSDTRQEGFIKIITNGLVNKEDLYFQPTAVAFSKLLHSDWF